MHDAINAMLKKYKCQTCDDYVNALREIMQELALLGLWRGKFFEHAAFYGGTALRILYGLDRFSEDIDFSLLQPDPDFLLDRYREALCREIKSFGFNVSFERKAQRKKKAIESAFLKVNTCQELIVIEANETLLRNIHPAKVLKIKLEVDISPPGGFLTESRYMLNPIPFSVRVYSLPDLFAGKLHAILCRKWRTRIKGRDWYDLVWYISHHPKVNISHLDARMRQSGDYTEKTLLNRDKLISMLSEKAYNLDVDSARSEVEPFVSDKRTIETWSHDFFLQLINRIEL